MISITARDLAKANRFAKKAFEWMQRELERGWRREWGSRWVEELCSRDDDYGDAFAFAEKAGAKVLGIPSHLVAEVLWDGDELVLELYAYGA